MRCITRFLLVSLFAVVLASGAQATVTPFILDGTAGLGLLGGNENPAVAGGGSGGILSSISYDDVTNILTVDIGWGSGNGFTDLTGVAAGAHIHGPTANAAPTGFSDNAGILYFLDALPGYNNSASNGGFNGTVSINPVDEANLLGDFFYINIHTAVNGGGEIRGHLVAVPEPSTFALLALGLVGVAARRRSA